MASTTYSQVVPPVRPSRNAAVSRSGIWVAMFAITMSFAAFTSALFVRQASNDWSHLAAPKILFANTLVLLLSSATFELSRRAIAAKTSLSFTESSRLNVLFWLATTLLLGCAFLAGQYLAWRQLASQGLYLATNPNSSFFYLFTGMHALHLLGGIAALLYLVSRTAFGASFRLNLFNGIATYWHFMGVLWLYLLLIISTRL
jgi:cytochrome c oxidase subunit III